MKQALDIVKFSLDSGMNPIVFCQYIQTAEYVGQYITKQLASSKKFKKVVVGIVTSRLADEERKMKIDALSQEERHVLVCTDCLSEGVNLQQGFEAVIHYDLPWNPNRMEQRNGRIDRFGQTADAVLISTLHAENNPVDDIVLNVLYKKQEEIRKKLGVYLPIADNDASLMETIMQRIFDANVPTQTDYMQLSLFDDDPEWKRQQDEELEIQLKKWRRTKNLTHLLCTQQQADGSNPTYRLVGRSEVCHRWCGRHSRLRDRAAYACWCQRAYGRGTSLLQLPTLGVASQLAPLLRRQSNK